MQLIPVIDLLDGIVVRGVAGERANYRRMDSRLTEASDALSIARAFRETLKLTTLYLADLDAIEHQRPNFTLYQSLADEQFDMIVDAGLRDIERAQRVVDAGAAGLIAGLETLTGPDHLGELCRRFGTERVVFSLDMKNGKALGRLESWRTSDPFEIAVAAADAGVSRMIVLDLAQVGVGGGVTTMDLCRRLVTRLPEARLITGGGVRSFDDVKLLAENGIDAVLVASALHDGRIGPAEIAKLATL